PARGGSRRDSRLPCPSSANRHRRSANRFFRRRRGSIPDWLTARNPYVLSYVLDAALVARSRTRAAISSADKPASRRISALCSLRRGASLLVSTGVSDHRAA